MKMKIQKKNILFLLSILFCSLLFSNSAKAEENFETKEYNVSIKVKENKVYQVQEDIAVNFLREKHGIYRYIPFKGTTHSKVNGKKVEKDYKAQIKNVNVSESYTKETQNANTLIKIGDKDKTILGKHSYQISYDYKFYDENEEENGYDEFYCNVLPNNWETPIDKTSIVIEMPKQFDKKMLEVFVGKYGVSSSKDISCHVDGKKIYISNQKKLRKGEGITVRILLPESYFKNVANHKIHMVLAVLFALAGSIILIMMWYRYGKDRPFVKTVEFYPPEDMSPAEIGYALDGVVNKKDMISLIIYFAKKGYLTIQEEKAGHKSKMSLHKIKNKDIEAMPKYQKTFYNGLFLKGDHVYVNKLGEKFYKKYEKAKGQLEKSFIDSQTGQNKIFEKQSFWARVGAGLLSGMILAIGILLSCMISCDFSDICAFIPMALIDFVIIMVMVLSENSNIGKNAPSKLWSGIKYAICFGVAIAITGVIFYLISENIWIALSYAVFIVTSCIAIGFMGRRTEYGAALLGKLLGFRDFILKAEKDRIEKLVEENPSYFYDILPYAYVLNVSDTWAKKFENIKVDPPQWYYGYDNRAFNTYLFMSHMNHCTESMSKGIDIAAPSSNSSVGSFSGGGGFSGGGTGGGGGGSW